MKFFVGTSGYSYNEWKGNFYPEKIKSADMLPYYSERFSTVEINNTFYRIPKKEVFESWKNQVPDNFKFSIKAPKKITHIKKLKDAETDVDYLCSVSSSLNEKRGVILFQLPPYFRKDIEILKNFIEKLPKNIPAAFEFRHESLFDKEVYDLLSDYNFPLCLSDTDEDPVKEITSTADWGYLRLRKTEYKKKDLSDWFKIINKENWQKVFIFFKHEDEGKGPDFAKTFMDLNEIK